MKQAKRKIVFSDEKGTFAYCKVFKEHRGAAA